MRYSLLLALLLTLPAAAINRGVTVTLKDSEAAGAGVAGQVQLYSNSYALVIGNDQYSGGWPRLSKAVSDAGIACTIVPGITAATGAAAALGIPLTHRQQTQAVTFVTAHRQTGGLGICWDLVCQPQQTVVFYMGLSLLEDICSHLLARGLSPNTAFCIVANATCEDQICLQGNLGNITALAATAHLPSPALLIMGATPISQVLNQANPLALAASC